MPSRSGKHIEAHEFDHPNADEVIKLTVSLGVATIPDDASTVEDSIRIADERLIRAKRAGRKPGIRQ